MAKFKNKIDGKRQRISRPDGAQLEEIDKNIKKAEHKDIILTILFIICVSLLLSVIIYAGISIFGGEALFNS